MRTAYTILASVVIAAACGGDSDPTEPGPSITVTIPSQTIVSGTTVQATAAISNGPAPNVTWSSSNQGVATVSATGEITGLLAGGARITATSGQLTGSVNVTVTPGAAVRVVVYAGDGQSRPRGQVLPDPLCTLVLDAAGNKIVGAVVTYVIETGGGTLAQPNAPATGQDGIAISGLWTLGSSQGVQTVKATSPGATPVTFMATAS
jgi:Big-like domain-containing protein